MDVDNERGGRPYLDATNACIEPKHAWATFLLERVARAEDALWGQPGDEEPAWAAFFTDRARVQISRALLERLVLCTQFAASELLDGRMREKNPVLAWDINLATNAEREEVAASLLADLKATGGAVLFESAPLLPSLVVREESRFINAVREMGVHLAADAPRIAREFFATDSLGGVLGVKIGDGDVHCGGRTVCMLMTSCGRVLYKPHDCRLGAAYDRLVREHFSDVLVVPGVVLGDGYGWCAFVEEQPVESEEQVDTFFRRMGGALALSHALGSTDLHFENWVACGDMPALVDVETVITPRPRTFGLAMNEERRDPEGFTSDINQSVLQLAMLPCLRNDMQLSPLMSDSPKAKCPPCMDGVRQTVIGHEDAFLEGFSQGYDRCLALRGELQGWLDGLAGMPVRFLVRNTDYYAILWRRLMKPAALHSDQDRAAVTARLAEYFKRNHAPELAGIGEAEAASLLEGDIPYFCVPADGRDLCSDRHGSVVAPEYFETSGVQAARKRLGSLGAADKQFELGILRQAFNQALVKADRESQVQAWKDRMPLIRAASPAEALEGATATLHALDDWMLTGPSGCHGWVGRVGENDAVSALRPFLAMGMMGLGVFFSAFAASSAGEPDRVRAGELCDVVLAYMGRFTDALAPEKLSTSVASSMLGITDGFGGLLLGLARMQAASGDARCTEMARRTAYLAGTIDLAEATRTDVYSGLAGLIVGLSACARQGMLDAGAAAPTIAGAAEALVALRSTADPTAPDGSEPALLWDTIGKGRPIGGFAHGQIGVACALLDAAALVPSHVRRADWVAAACDALAFERRSFSEKLGTWPDFRVSAKPTVAMHGLCSGAPGAGLAYLRCRDVAARAGLSAEVCAELDEGVRRAASACVREPLLMRDHVCCGNAGVLDFLVELCSRVPQIVDEATLDACRVKAAESAGAIAVPGWRFLPPGYRNAPSPGLFYGAAGAGYELLRFAGTDLDGGTAPRLLSLMP